MRQTTHEASSRRASSSIFALVALATVPNEGTAVNVDGRSSTPQREPCVAVSNVVNRERAAKVSPGDLERLPDDQRLERFGVVVKFLCISRKAFGSPFQLHDSG